MTDKNWYQVKTIQDCEMFHRGCLLKAKQYVYLNENEAKLHNGKNENLVKSDAPETILDCAIAEDFNEFFAVTSNQSSVNSKDFKKTNLKNN